MKINKIQSVSATAAYQRQQFMQQTHNKGKRKDELTISVEAQEMLDTQNKVIDPERVKKIEQLKHEVSTGTYYVDATKIAEKLIPIIQHTQKGDPS